MFKIILSLCSINNYESKTQLIFKFLLTEKLFEFKIDFSQYIIYVWFERHVFLILSYQWNFSFHPLNRIWGKIFFSFYHFDSCFHIHQVHIRIASPPIRYPCYMGINIPTREELVANRVSSNQELCAYLGADSVVHLSIEGLKNAVQRNITTVAKNDDNNNEHGCGSLGHCTACLDGDYPVKLDWWKMNFFVYCIFLYGCL